MVSGYGNLAQGGDSIYGGVDYKRCEKCKTFRAQNVLQPFRHNNGRSRRLQSAYIKDKDIA